MRIASIVTACDVMGSHGKAGKTDGLLSSNPRRWAANRRDYPRNLADAEETGTDAE